MGCRALVRKFADSAQKRAYNGPSTCGLIGMGIIIGLGLSARSRGRPRMEGDPESGQGATPGHRCHPLLVSHADWRRC